VKKLVTDYLHVGPQVFHSSPTPRIGGIGIFVAVILTLFVLRSILKDSHLSIDLRYATLSFLPVFLAGLAEDITRKLSPLVRMTFVSLSAILAFFLLDIKITRIGIPLVDGIFSFEPISFLFTTFALVGIANAVNIIDGFNGLASMISMMNLAAIGYVALKLKDFEIVFFCLILIFALLGFFVLNYPFGLIFLGDGGAYFVGFAIGIISVMLVKKHANVSPWFVFLVNIYPIYETIFSIYRKRVIRKKSPMEPDGIHLHMLFYRVVTKKFLKMNSSAYRNPITSIFLWLLNALALIPAVIFWNYSIILVIFSAAFVVSYTYIYWSILKTKLPKSVLSKDSKLT